MTTPSAQPDVSILVPDLRSPVLGAAIRIRELIAPYTAEIIGPDFGGGICAMYRHSGPFVAIQTRRLYRWPNFAWESRRIERAVRGRCALAVKAYMNTLPVALRLQSRGVARAVVFLDEWDAAVLEGLTPFQRIARFIAHARHPLEDVYYPIVERRIREAAVVLSTTTDLQRRFGGHVVAMGVDTDRFKPRPAAATAALRRELGLEGLRTIVFGGVVRPHKGVELILEALAQLPLTDVVLLVVGPVTEHLRALMSDPRYSRRIRVAGAPLNDPDGINAAISRLMPDYLDLADLVVLPMTDTPLARSQMPMKIFEAMAMAKPIVATAVGDLPRVLGDTAWITPAGDASAIAKAIEHAFANPDKMRARGLSARERCVRLFSKEVCGAEWRRHLGLACTMRPDFSLSGEPPFGLLRHSCGVASD